MSPALFQQPLQAPALPAQKPSRDIHAIRRFGQVARFVFLSCSWKGDR